MHSTCLPRASSRRRSPTARAVWPPMPASTSSNTSVACANADGLGRLPRAPPRRRRTIGHRGRQHHARELSAGADLAQRTGGHAGVGGDHELHGIAAARARALAGERRPRSPRPPSPARRAARAPPAEARRVAARAPGAERRTWSSSCRPAPRSGAAVLARAPPRRPPAARAAPAPLGVVEHGRERATVLAHQSLDAREALFDLLSASLLARRAVRSSRAARRRAPATRSRARASARRARPGVGSTPATSSSRAATPASSGAAPGPRPSFGRKRIGAGARGGAQRVGAAHARGRRAAARARAGPARRRRSRPARARAGRARARAPAESSRSSSSSASSAPPRRYASAQARRRIA